MSYLLHTIPVTHAYDKKTHNLHHIIPTSIGGKHNYLNTTPLEKLIHITLHRLFGNLPPHKQLIKLIRISKSPLAENFHKRVSNIITSTPITDIYIPETISGTLPDTIIRNGIDPDQRLNDLLYNTFHTITELIELVLQNMHKLTYKNDNHYLSKITEESIRDKIIEFIRINKFKLISRQKALTLMFGNSLPHEMIWILLEINKQVLQQTFYDRITEEIALAYDTNYKLTIQDIPPRDNPYTLNYYERRFSGIMQGAKLIEAYAA